MRGSSQAFVLTILDADLGLVRLRAQGGEGPGQFVRVRGPGGVRRGHGRREEGHLSVRAELWKGRIGTRDGSHGERSRKIKKQVESSSPFVIRLPSLSVPAERRVDARSSGGHVHVFTLLVLYKSRIRTHTNARAFYVSCPRTICLSS